MAPEGTDHYDVRVLGPISVAHADGQLDPGGRKPRLLLALLLADVGAVITADQLIDGLWGEGPPSTARKTLQVHVSNLRRGLGPSFPLRTVRGGYTIDAERVTIDAVLFQGELQHGAELLQSAPAQASSIITGALRRWNGPAYADVADEDAIRSEGARLTDLRLLALELRVEADLGLGRHARVLGELEVLTTDHPYRERFRMHHMLALYRSGRQAEALRAYERTRRTLADDLGVDPGPELRRLHQEILEHSSALDLVVDDTFTATDVFADTDTASADVSAVRSVGTTVRGYELRECLGVRASSTVFRAYQASVGREVALEIVAPDLANDPEFVKRFENECRMLAELEHPHIVTLLDYWRDPDGTCLVMPLMRGGTLARSLERGPLEKSAALHVLDQIGGALSYAHRHGVVHRDLRPTNILLDDDGNAFLSDFRFSVTTGSPNPESERQILGYISPEELAGRSVGSPADVYGLALLTCEMLTGTRPAPGQRPNSFAFSPFELPSAFDDVIAQATDPNPDRRYERIDAFLRALRQAFGADVVSGTAPIDADSIRNPYKGLRSFGESDAADFFGRDDLLHTLIDRVATNNVTAVVGPSGSGKSSLVKAGLIPAARRGCLGRVVVVTEMFPGTYPFEELESALLRVAVDRPNDLLGELCSDERGLMRASKQILPDDDTDLLLIIDQFEELFALTSNDAVRNAFLASLVCVAHDDRSRVRVVLTLRADFFDRPLNHPEFGELLTASMIAVTLPSEPSLSEAIRLPAHLVGLDLEAGLIPTILRDVSNEPGALPLLEYALTELADTRDGNLLTVAGYARTGGVLGALARRAEEIYSGLSPSGRDSAQAVFLRLVSVRDDTDDTRRRVRRTELEALGLNPQSLASVLDAYGSFRLLSFDRDPVTRGPTVEVAHEALIREWPRCRAWIDDVRDDLRTERQLESAVGEWEHNDRDESVLIGGGRLDRYEDWAGSTNVRLTENERAFLARSRESEDDRARASATRRHRTLVGVSLLAAVAVAMALIAIVQRNRADDQAGRATTAAASADALRAAAEQVAAIEEARALASRATTLDSSDISPLLALEAYDGLDDLGVTDAVVTGALYQAIFDQRIETRLPARADSKGSAPLSPDGARFAAPYDTSVDIVDARTGELVSTIDVPRGVDDIRWNSADGNLMIGTADGAVDVWSAGGDPVRTLEVSDTAVSPEIIADGRVTYVRITGQFPRSFVVQTRDLDSNELVFETAITSTLGVSSDRSAFVTDEGGVNFVVREAGTFEEIARFGVADGRFEGNNFTAHWAPDANQIWISNGFQTALIDVPTGEVVRAFDGESAPWGSAYAVPSPDGAVLAMVGFSQWVFLVDSTTGAVVDRIDTGDVGPDIAWAPTGRTLISGQSGEMTVWRLDRPNAAEVVWPATDFSPVVTATLSSGEAFFADGDGNAEIFDPATGLGRSLPADVAGDAGGPPVVSADGSTIVMPDGDGVTIHDAATGEIRARGPAQLTRPLGISQDGRWAVAGTSLERADGPQSIAIVDARSGDLHESVGTLVEGASAAFSSDGSSVAIAATRVATDTAEPNSAVWLVDVLTGDVLVRGAPQACITAVAMSDDDSMVVTGACDGRVSLFDVDVLHGEEPWTAEFGGSTLDDTAVVGVAFTEDGDTVIVTRADGRVEAFDANGDFVRRWAFDVGDQVGAPVVGDGLVRLGVGASFGASPSGGGGMIGMPVDLTELADLARATVTRDFTELECQEYLSLSSCAER